MNTPYGMNDADLAEQLGLFFEETYQIPMTKASQEKQKTLKKKVQVKEESDSSTSEDELLKPKAKPPPKKKQSKRDSSPESSGEEHGRKRKPIETEKDLEKIKKRIKEAKSTEELEEIKASLKTVPKEKEKKSGPKVDSERLIKFRRRHIEGIPWMEKFLSKVKTTASTRPYVEEMLRMEREFKVQIEENLVFKPVFDTYFSTK